MINLREASYIFVPLLLTVGHTQGKLRQQKWKVEYQVSTIQPVELTADVFVTISLKKTAVLTRHFFYKKLKNVSCEYDRVNG